MVSKQYKDMAKMHRETITKPFQNETVNRGSLKPSPKPLMTKAEYSKHCANCGC